MAIIMKIYWILAGINLLMGAVLLELYNSTNTQCAMCLIPWWFESIPILGLSFMCVGIGILIKIIPKSERGN